MTWERKPAPDGVEFVVDDDDEHYGVYAVVPQFDDAVERSIITQRLLTDGETVTITERHVIVHHNHVRFILHGESDTPCNVEDTIPTGDAWTHRMWHGWYATQGDKPDSPIEVVWDRHQ
jgi:hypothetical protein